MGDNRDGIRKYWMRSRLPEIVMAKERRLNRKIQIGDIAEETKIHRNTIARWLSPEPFGAIDSDVANRLKSWANCSLDDLLESVEIQTSL
jgi:transcriptional regulator with XRE-family HTH domain